jgi:hypothetical protein
MVDPTGHVAGGISFGGLIAIGPFGGRADVGLWIDDNGNLALVFDIGPAQGLAGNIGFSANTSGADTVKDMEGFGGQVGATLGMGLETGLDTSGNGSFGLSKEGAGFYVSETVTKVIPIINLSAQPHATEVIESAPQPPDAPNGDGSADSAASDSAPPRPPAPGEPRITED